MAGELFRGEKNARLALQSLSSPVFQAEALVQDVDPENVKSLQQSLADPRHQGRMQQQVLGDELKRIQGIQTQQIQQAVQALPQKLKMDLSPAKTGEPWPSPEAMMIRLMLQMKKRYPGMQRGPSTQQPF